jgi:hypothetical protein
MRYTHLELAFNGTDSFACCTDCPATACVEDDFLPPMANHAPPNVVAKIPREWCSFLMARPKMTLFVSKTR